SGRSCSSFTEPHGSFLQQAFARLVVFSLRQSCAVCRVLVDLIDHFWESQPRPIEQGLFFRTYSLCRLNRLLEHDCTRLRDIAFICELAVAFRMLPNAV